MRSGARRVLSGLLNQKPAINQVFLLFYARRDGALLASRQCASPSSSPTRSGPQKRNVLLTTNVPAYVDVANVVRVLPSDGVRTGRRREDLVGTRVDRACELKHPVAIHIDPPQVEVSAGTPAYRAGREVELERVITTRAQRLENALITTIDGRCLPAADARLEVCAWRYGLGRNLLGGAFNEREEEDQKAHDDLGMLKDGRHCLAAAARLKVPPCGG